MNISVSTLRKIRMQLRNTFCEWDESISLLSDCNSQIFTHKNLIGNMHRAKCQGWSSSSITLSLFQTHTHTHTNTHSSSPIHLYPWSKKHFCDAIVFDRTKTNFCKYFYTVFVLIYFSGILNDITQRLIRIRLRQSFKFEWKCNLLTLYERLKLG